MPNSVTIVSPVSGETVYLTTTSELIISTDFETDQGGTIARANCSVPSPHNGDPHSVSGDGDAEVKLGAHSEVVTYHGVTLTALLQTSDGITTYAQFSVNDVTLVIRDQQPTPIITVTNPPPPSPLPPGPPYFLVSESGVSKTDRERFVVEAGKPTVQYDPKLHAPKRNREVDPNAELTFAGTVADGKRDGVLSLSLARKRKKTELVVCHTVFPIPINMQTGAWSHTVAKNDVQKIKKLRQAVITLFDKGDVAETVSIPLKLK